MAASLAASSLRASSAGLRSNSALLVQRQRLGASAATIHRAWGGVALQPLQFNSFSASASVSATDVAAIISDELKFEQESYEKPVSRNAGAARGCLRVYLSLRAECKRIVSSPVRVFRYKLPDRHHQQNILTTSGVTLSCLQRCLRNVTKLITSVQLASDLVSSCRACHLQQAGR